MIYGGIIFRVVTYDHPGDPALAEAGPIRTEWLAQLEPRTWTLKRDLAFIFPRHLDAVTFAEKMRSRCHVSVTASAEQRDDNLRAVSASTAGAVKQAEQRVETSHSVMSDMESAPCPQPISLTKNKLAGPVHDRTAQNATALGPDSSRPQKRVNKRARMLALREAAKRTEPDNSERFWWKQGAYA